MIESRWIEDLNGEDWIIKLLDGNAEYVCYIGVKDYLNKTAKVQAIQLKSQ